MSKGYTYYDEVEPGSDGWGSTAYSGSGYSDHVCRPVIVDAEGRKNPIIRYESSQNAAGYVIEAERVVDHISHAAYRYRQFGSAYDRPEKVEDFLTKVQNEVSKPVTKVSGPSIPNWRSAGNSTGKDHGIGGTKYADDGNPFRKKQSEAYPQIHKGTNPRANEGPIAPSRPLGKPTNDIGTAVNFLTEAIKPNYGTNNAQIHDVSRPTKAGPLSSIHWRTGTNFPAQDRKQDSGEDDWENAVPRVATNPINNKEGNDKAKNRSAINFPSPTTYTPSIQSPTSTMQSGEVYPSSETIDSSEARRRYGKMKNQPVPEDSYGGTIDSNDAVRKYNGAKVPW